PTHTYPLSLHDALPISSDPGGGADGELLRLSDHQFYGLSTATLRIPRPRMDAPIPLWRTDIHALAADHGCKATGESSVLCDPFRDRKSTRLNSSHEWIS